LLPDGLAVAFFLQFAELALAAAGGGEGVILGLGREAGWKFCCGWWGIGGLLFGVVLVLGLLGLGLGLGLSLDLLLLLLLLLGRWWWWG